MIFLVIVPCILCFVYAWRRRRRLLQGNLPPLCGLSWPVIGLAHLWVRGSFWNCLRNIQIDCLKQRCVTLLHAGTNPNYTYYAICDPQDCAKVTETCLQRAFLVADSVKTVFGESLITSPVPIWESRRKHLNTAFDQLCTTGIPHRLARLLVEDLALKVGKGSFDPTRYVRSSIMRILLSTAFGINENDETFSKNVDLCMKSTENIINALYMRHKNVFMHNKLLFYVTKSRRKLDDAMRTLSAVFDDVIERSKTKNKDDILQDDQETKCQNSSVKGLVDFLLELKNQDIYSEEDVNKELLTIILSGYNTLSIALKSVMSLLGSHKEVQDKVFEEFNSIFHGAIIENIKKEDLAKLKYLDAVIMETLRLYPPVTILTRVVDKKIQLEKYTLEPATNCLVCVYAINRHSTWGEDIEEFRPERWLDPASPKAFASFGLGQRDCIGKQFSLDVLKILIVNLLKEYRVLTTGDKIELKQEIFLSSLRGNHILLQRRKLSV